MNIQLEKLIRLQSIDEQVVDLEKDLKRIPEQIALNKKELEAEKKDLNEVNDAIAELKKQRMKMEQDVKAEQDHMASVKQKLPSVKTNKEYTAILTEVDGIKEKISKIEDKELEILEALDQKEALIPGLTARFSEDEAKFKDYQSKKEAEKAETEAELKGLIEKRDALKTEIEAKWVKHYDNVFNRRGTNVVVMLEGDTCLGCYQTILPQRAVEIRLGEVIHECNHCNRILYWVAKEEPGSQEGTAVPK